MADGMAGQCFMVKKYMLLYSASDDP